MAHQRRKLNDLLSSLFKDLNEMGVAFGADLKPSLQPFDANSSKSEEEFTMARIYVSKMKSEVKNLVQRCQTLESSQGDCLKKMDESERELVDLRLLITQHEAKMKALQENMKVFPSFNDIYCTKLFDYLFNSYNYLWSWLRMYEDGFTFCVNN